MKRRRGICRFLPGPARLKNILRLFETRLVTRLATEHRALLPLASMGLCLLWILERWLLIPGPFESMGSIRIIEAFRDWLPYLPMAALGYHYLPTRFRPTWLFAIATIGWAWPLRQTYAEIGLPPPLLALAVSGPALLLISRYYLNRLRSGSNKFSLTVAYLLVSVTLAAGALLYGAASGLPPVAASPHWRMGLICFIIFTLATAWRGGQLESAAALLLNPAHGIRGVLWPAPGPESESSDRRDRTWWQGNIDLLRAMAMILVLRSIEKKLGPWAGYTGPLDLGARVYIYMMGDIALFNIISGTSRIFGFNVPDATKYMLLGRTPGELWRQGNVYNYAFNMEFIYFPLLRRFGTAFPALLAAFARYFVSHFGIHVIAGTYQLAVGLPFAAAGDGARTVVYAWTVWSLWFLALLAGMYCWPIKIRKKFPNIRGWLSVLLTHLIAIGIQYLALKAMAAIG